MRHAADYQVIISDQGIPVFVLPFSLAPLKNPVMLYDGGRHATLYRSDEDVILLDYLPSEVCPFLSQCTWAVVIEENPDGTDVSVDYKVAVKKVKINPHIDNLL